jgi:ATP phosphoribosyltransferase
MPITPPGRGGWWSGWVPERRRARPTDTSGPSGTRPDGPLSFPGRSRTRLARAPKEARAAARAPPDGHPHHPQQRPTVPEPRTPRIALPNKGRLSEEALDLFETAGLKAQFRADRALVARLGDEFQAIFVRAQDIPELVADGAAEMGMTGADLVEEAHREEVVELLDLGFGRCRLVVAVRDESRVRSVEDLPDGTRVATSFPGITARHFASLGTRVQIVPVSGAAEIAPHLGVAEVIVDLTSTGSTLRVNGLREIGTIMESTARLIGNAPVLEEAQATEASARLRTALESALRARARRYLMANVPRDRLDEVRRVLPGISGPTIVDVLDDDRWVAAHAVVDADRVYQTIALLKEIGAEGILVTRIERLMPRGALAPRHAPETCPRGLTMNLAIDTRIADLTEGDRRILKRRPTGEPE